MLYALGEAWLVLDAAAPPTEADGFRPRVGGDAARLALAFAARGGQAALLTQLGDDPFGHRIAAALAAQGVKTGQICFTARARTPLVFTGGGEWFPCRDAELRYAPEQLPAGLFAPGDALAFSSAGLVDSPLRYTHLAALTAARDAGALCCFVPQSIPALWPEPQALTETVRLFLPRADVAVLAEEELPLLFGTDAPRVALWHLLRGHTQLVLLAEAEGVRAVTRAAQAFRPGPAPTVEELAAGVLARLAEDNVSPRALPGLRPAQLARLLGL